MNHSVKVGEIYKLNYVPLLEDYGDWHNVDLPVKVRVVAIKRHGQMVKLAPIGQSIGKGANMFFYVSSLEEIK